MEERDQTKAEGLATDTLRSLVVTCRYGDMSATKHKTSERVTSHATYATTIATNEALRTKAHWTNTHGHIGRTEHGRSSTAIAGSDRLHTL